MLGIDGSRAMGHKSEALGLENNGERRKRGQVLNLTDGYLTDCLTKAQE